MPDKVIIIVVFTVVAFSDATFFHIRVDAWQLVNSLLKLKFKLQSVYIFIAKVAAQ